MAMFNSYVSHNQRVVGKTWVLRVLHMFLRLPGFLMKFLGFQASFPSLIRQITDKKHGSYHVQWIGLPYGYN